MREAKPTLVYVYTGYLAQIYIYIHCFHTTPYLSPRIAETEMIFRAEEIHKYGVEDGY